MRNDFIKIRNEETLEQRAQHETSFNVAES